MLTTRWLTSKLMAFCLLLIHACYAQVAMAEEKSRANSQPLPWFSSPIIGPSFSRTPKSSIGFGGGSIDLNGDGIEEIVQPVSVYPGTGLTTPQSIVILGVDRSSGVYSAKTSEYLSTKPPKQVHSRVFEIADFNGDGLKDYFLGGTGYDETPFLGEPDYFLLSKRDESKNVHETVRAKPDSLTYTHAAASGDINDDDVPDLYVGTLCCSVQGPYFLLGTKNGAPEFSDDRLNDTVRNRIKKYASALLVDLDSDSKLDLVLGGDAGFPSVAYLNDGGGRFTQAIPNIILPKGLFGEDKTIVVDVVSTDIDTDGDADVLMAQTGLDPSYVGYGIQVLINKDGILTDQSWRLRNHSGYRAFGGWRTNLFFADFFGDGLVDIVTHRFCDGDDEGYLIWLNDGSGMFEPHSAELYKPTPSFSCNFVYPVDFNGDGRSDIVDIYQTSDTEAVSASYRNNGLLSNSRSIKPLIVRQPSSQSVGLGGSVSLTASVRGSRPLRFQWFKDGKAVQGATRPVLTMPSLRIRQVGNYRLRIKNAAGTTFTNTVSVGVNPTVTNK